MTPSPLSEAQLSAWDADGFVNAGPLLETGEVEELAAEMDRFIDAASPGGAARAEAPFIQGNLSNVPGEVVHQFVNLWEVSRPFARVLRHPRIVEAAVALARADDLQVWYDQAQCKPAHVGGVSGWHQDAPYWGPIGPPLALTAWIALDDADIDNGCMWMVPGSHRWGERQGYLFARHDRREPETFGELPPIETPSGAPGWRGARPCLVRRGEVHFHHCLTWHGSPLNRTARSRRAFAVHYMPGGVRYVGDPEHPLASRIRVPVGSAMLDDPERFPVVFRGGRPEPA